MADPTRALTRQLLEWILERPHTYAEANDVWRTSCPRLSIWEDACIDGLVDVEGDTQRLTLTAKGRDFLDGTAAAASGGAVRDARQSRPFPQRT